MSNDAIKKNGIDASRAAGGVAGSALGAADGEHPEQLLTGTIKSGAEIALKMLQKKFSKEKEAVQEEAKDAAKDAAKEAGKEAGEKLGFGKSVGDFAKSSSDAVNGDASAPLKSAASSTVKMGTKALKNFIKGKEGVFGKLKKTLVKAVTRAKKAVKVMGNLFKNIRKIIMKIIKKILETVKKMAVKAAARTNVYTAIIQKILETAKKAVGVIKNKAVANAEYEGPSK